MVDKLLALAATSTAIGATNSAKFVAEHLPLEGRRTVPTAPANLARGSFVLFVDIGLEQTALDAIAVANAVVWGASCLSSAAIRNDIPLCPFDCTLDGFRKVLVAIPPYF